MDCEKINPYSSDSRSKSEQIKTMFDNIAPAYDFMNRAMTFGIDRCWRRKAVDMLAKTSPREILDVATGTGDLAMLLARRIKESKVTGLDLSEGMIAVGRKKVGEAGLEERISLQCGDCLNMPFEENSFDAVTVAYGVRNFENLLQGYREMLRVLRPGGTINVIELSTPTSPIVKPLYKFYTRYIIPTVGRMVSKDVRAYAYLPESIAAVPQRQAMTSLMSEAGFINTSYRTLTFGTCCIYTATKP